MNRRWPWLKVRYGFIVWPVCWQGWVTIFGLWVLVGCGFLLKPYIPVNSPYALAEGIIDVGYMLFAFSKTDLPQMRWP